MADENKPRTPETRVGEIMTRNVITARPATSVEEVVGLMTRHRITGLPVVDDGNRLIGVVSESDIIGKAGDLVAEVMTNGSFTVTEDTTLGEAAELLLRRRVRRLPVVRAENELVGLVSRSDLIQFFAHHVWTCSWCGKRFRGFYAPSSCSSCGGETFTIKELNGTEPASDGARAATVEAPVPPAATGTVTGQQFSPGLEGIVAARTVISDVNGRTGKLLYRGYDIADLAAHSSFEETVFLLWRGVLPKRAELEELRRELGRERRLPDQVLNLLNNLDPKATPMDLLRTGVSALSHFDPDVRDMSLEANIRKARRLVGQTSTLVAAIGRLNQGEEPISPDPSLSVAADFLRMYTGRTPDDTAAKVFDVCLILHADHGLNASTFTARVIASTLSDMHSAIVGAIGALKGPLHGGANAAVMEMLQEIGDVDKADAWIRDALARKKRVMGFGHRVYKVYDPRATVLKRFSKELGERAGDSRWYDMSERIEKVVMEVKKLNPNVDFYSASTYHVLGLPSLIFTPIFALSRMAGWTAHVLEQYEGNRLMRPESEYVGPASANYVPLEQRDAATRVEQKV